MKFSQRIGATPVGKLAQFESMDDELRASLWSLITLFYLEKAESVNRRALNKDDQTLTFSLADLITRLWLDHFKKPIDEIDQYWGNWRNKLRIDYFNAKWFEVYDLVEFIAGNWPIEVKKGFIEYCNIHSERENSAYRFVSEQLAPITSRTEIESVESAIDAATPFAGAAHHLQTGLTMMSD